jgi:hypothetical protein
MRTSPEANSRSEFRAKGVPLLILYTRQGQLPHGGDEQLLGEE